MHQQHNCEPPAWQTAVCMLLAGQHGNDLYPSKQHQILSSHEPHARAPWGLEQLQSSPSHNQLLYHPHMQPIQAVGRSRACRLTQLTLCTGKDTPCRCGHLAWRVQAVGTFGFRGEALSSLCALADVSVVTRCKEALLGQKLSYDHAGRLGQQSPTARAPGTTVTAKQLFHNLPVRHKVSTCCARSDWAASEHATSLVGWGSRAPGPLALAAVSLSSSCFTMCLCGTSWADRLEALVGQQLSIPLA